MNQNDYFKDLNTGLPQDIAYEKAIGNFDKAIQLIDLKLQENISTNLKNSLLVQKEIIKRLPLDYPYTFNQAYQKVLELIPDFKQEELQQYIDERRFSTIYINKEIHLFIRFIEVLRLYEDFNSRCKDYIPFDLSNWDHYKQVKEIKEEKETSYRFSIKQSIRIKDEKFIPNENYLVHIPLPRKNETQSEIVIEDVYPKEYILDEDINENRCIYWNKKLIENDEFYVQYSYLSSYRYVKLDKGVENKTVTTDLGELQPHIVFSKFVKDTAYEITKDCKDPFSKARAIYDYMTLNMKYSFQPSYFVMDNIVETCLKTNRGDCGIFALTFITLCRAIGIPAKWQSSKCIIDNEASSHDWARFYVEPYGWLYADVSYGIGCHRNHFEEGRQYYFGNLDSYRMVANEKFQNDLSGNKKYYRNDPYDNQTGEVEDSKRGYILNVDYDSVTTLLNAKKESLKK